MPLTWQQSPFVSSGVKLFKNHDFWVCKYPRSMSKGYGIAICDTLHYHSRLFRSLDSQRCPIYRTHSVWSLAFRKVLLPKALLACSYHCPTSASFQFQRPPSNSARPPQNFSISSHEKDECWSTYSMNDLLCLFLPMPLVMLLPSF